MDSQSRNLKEILSLIKKMHYLKQFNSNKKKIIMQIIWGYFALETTCASDCLCCERNLPRSGSHTSSVLLQLFLRCYVAGKQWLATKNVTKLAILSGYTENSFIYPYKAVHTFCWPTDYSSRFILHTNTADTFHFSHFRWTLKRLTVKQDTSNT